MRPAFVLLMPLLACNNQIRGQLEGAPVHIRSAMFVQEDFLELVDGDSLIVVQLVGLTNACSVYQDYWDDFEDAAAPEDFAQAWSEHMPDEFWLIELTLRVSDPNEDLGGQTLTGMPWTAWVEEPDSVVGVFTHYMSPLDLDFYQGSSNWESYYDYYLSDGGTLELTRHRPGESLRGRFSTTAVEPGDGSSAGVLDLEFDAERCLGVERYLF